MNKTKTKRRKVWVNEYGHELGSIAWHTRREAAKESEDVTGTVALIEVRPGDVVLSREGAEELRAVIEAHWRSTGQTTTERDRALALLRGRR